MSKPLCQYYFAQPDRPQCREEGVGSYMMLWLCPIHLTVHKEQMPLPQRDTEPWEEDVI